LHVHTDHSFLDGCSKVDNLIKQASAMGMPAIAMTDHGNMCGAIDFYTCAKKYNIKPLLGCEVYFVNDHKMEEKPKRQTDKTDDISDVDFDGNSLSPRSFPANQIFHKTLLAKDYEGFINLGKLVSEAFVRGFYYRPRIDFEALAKYSKGIIALSGCLNGVASQYMMYNDYETARAVTGKFLDIFGKENYYIEVQNHFLSPQQKILPGMLKLAKEMDLKVVATNDVHYVEKKDSTAHDSMLCIQTGRVLSDERRLRYPNNEFYLKSREEMLKCFSSNEEVLTNTLEVAEKIDIKINFGENHFPKYEIPLEITFNKDENNFYKILDLYVKKQNEVLLQDKKEANFSLSEEQKKFFMKNGLFLFNLCKEGLKERYNVDYDNPENYTPQADQEADYAQKICDKLEYELSIIIGAGFVDYFLIVYDFIDWARRHGIPVGPGRGSGAGCMVAYLLKITDIEPLRFGLLFERMLSLERVSPPDFDVDFCQRRRDEVVEYVRQKYGKDRVANIATFGTLGAKQVVRDLARVNSVDYALATDLAKKIPDDLKITLDESLEKSAELKDAVEKSEINQKIFKDGKVIEGMIRQTGKHACGIIIGDQELTNLVPMMLQDGDLTTQFTKDPVEKLGLLKADFLGLKTLTVISDAQTNVHIARKDTSLDIEKVSLNDKATYNLLNKGNTLGVFQLESEGMRNLCRRIGLSSFEEIIALIALYRPGPMQFIDQFVEGKKDSAKIQIPHPMLKELVSETYGVLVYQEQVMEAARIIAGYTLGQADILRRAMGKKKPEVMAKEKSIFVERAFAANNISKDEAEKIFAILEKFAEYGFNKSHSAAYAMLSYRTAYLKANYPVEFMASVLSSEMGFHEKVEKFIEGCEDINIKVLGPDINISRENFTPVINPDWNPLEESSFEKSSGTIRYGFAAIKGIGDIAAASIVKERDENGPFKDVLDFVKRVGATNLNKRILESLILTGAFESFNIDRAHLLASVEALMAHATEFEEDKLIGQTNLFDMLEDDVSNDSLSDIINTRVSLMDTLTKLNYEKDLLGFYVSGHPMSQYAAFDMALDVNPEPERVKRVMNAPYRICGVVSGIKKRFAKKDNRPWCFFSLSTRAGVTYSMNMFPDSYINFGHVLAEGQCFCIEGDARSDNGSIKYNARSADSIENVINSSVEKIDWVIDAFADASNFVRRLSSYVTKNNSANRMSHSIRVKVDENSYMIMSLPACMESSFNLAEYELLVKESSVLSVDVKARALSTPNKTFKNFNKGK